MSVLFRHHSHLNYLGEAFFAETCKGLKEVDVIVTSRFTQEGVSSTNGGGVRHIALTIYTSICLCYMLRSLDLGIPSPSIRKLGYIYILCL